MSRSNKLARAGVLGILLLGACTEDNPVAPEVPTPTEPVTLLTALRCTATVGSPTIDCARADDPSTGARLAVTLFGGQDRYVKLTSSSVSYDGGTQIFSADVTVENLLSTQIGTDDGVTPDPAGVRVFFHEAIAAVGGGSVAVANADGTDAFTGSDQPYFQYSEILDTYQVSAAKNWQFQITGTVSSFSFIVYLAAEFNEDAARVDRIWSGDTSSDWAMNLNWEDDAAMPTVAEAVLVPLAGAGMPNMPVLDADHSVAALRVGTGSTLELAGFTLESAGNVVSAGTITGGTVRMTGTNSRVSGTVDALEVAGTVQLQGATTATGAVTVTGALSIQDRPLTISIP